MRPFIRSLRAPRLTLREVVRLASGAAIVVALAMTGTALGAESPSPASPLPLRVRIHSIPANSFKGGRESIADGNAVGMVGDTLLFTQLHVDQEERDTRNGPVRFGLLDADRIEVRRSSPRHVGQAALIGGIAGVVLGFVGTQVASKDPFFGTPTRNRDAIWAPVGGGAFGALLGAGFGALTHTQRWEPVDREQLRRLLQSRSASALPR
jgi:hypothetical protein